MSNSRIPDKSPEPTPDGAASSAVARKAWPGFFSLGDFPHLHENIWLRQKNSFYID
jgi:hypothetical protein